MCGISSYIGKEKAMPMLLHGIKRLEYRGYDSFGFCTQEKDEFKVKKAIGSIQEQEKALDFTDLQGKLGIAHTRWATHGKATEENAHPHFSQEKKIIAVHNGILENYQEMKKELEEEGYEFKSETDSEVIPHYLEQKIKEEKTIEHAMQNFMQEAEGTFAIVFMIKGHEKLYAMKRDSPLVIGKGKGDTFIASDIYAFSDKTNQAIYFDDNEYATITAEGAQFFDAQGNAIEKEVKTFQWTQDQETKETYKHYMLKEIMEEPKAMERMLNSIEKEQEKTFQTFIKAMKKAKKIVFVACGTAYFATLLGTYLLHKQGVQAQTLIASEFQHFAHLDEDSLVIAGSQSGETMDVIDALKYAKKQGATIASVVNVPHSTVQRMSDISFNTVAGQEICVASTKAFVNQSVFMLKLAQAFGFETDTKKLITEATALLNQKEHIKAIAESIADKKDMYILGRGINYPIAREIALKIKETSYIHAEGMMGGELKHGSIALIEEGTPVISIMQSNDTAMESNTKEVQARGANVITVGDTQGDLQMKTKNEGNFAILTAITGQLMAYYIANYLGRNPDKPRNLAKSVTVR
jgi:glutamine---fructose-6-phosphate transaminase (isomerizing)